MKSSRWLAPTPGIFGYHCPAHEGRKVIRECSRREQRQVVGLLLEGILRECIPRSTGQPCSDGDAGRATVANEIRRRRHASRRKRESDRLSRGTHPRLLHLVIRQPKRRGGDYFFLPRVTPLVRLFTRVDRLATVAAFRTARRASFTDSDVGKASATSGCSATSVVPFNRCAYLPRTPGPSEARSYSGRRSSELFRRAFFIGAALTARGSAG